MNRNVRYFTFLVCIIKKIYNIKNTLSEDVNKRGDPSYNSMLDYSIGGIWWTLGEVTDKTE